MFYFLRDVRRGDGRFLRNGSHIRRLELRAITQLARVFFRPEESAWLDVRMWRRQAPMNRADNDPRWDRGGQGVSDMTNAIDDWRSCGRTNTDGRVTGLPGERRRRLVT